ncbi:MAG: Na/Pi symporter [Pirellulales bacterium]|nr:Na/Pi symporter [Pirellulales bacterium]
MTDSVEQQRARWLTRLMVFVCAIYVFLAAIELFGDAFKMMGKGTADAMFCGLENPFAGLAVGIIVTAILQSSSATTSTVVAMVGAQTLSLRCAIPIIMGANIGTSITCAIVSLGHITENVAFRRAFAGATVHGFINLLTVVVLLPLELSTGIMEKSARWMVENLPLASHGGSFKSPVKTAVGWLAEKIEWCFREALETVGLLDVRETAAKAAQASQGESSLLAGMLAVFALIMIIASLVVITKNMKALMADRIEEWLNRVLSRNGLLGLAIGMVVTAVVQSSSITTSLLIPMFGSGVLALEAGFPIMLGANVGTTITALLAAAVAGPAGLTIALVHTQFNLLGTMMFLPFKRMRQIPIFLADTLGAAAERNRLWVAAYMVTVFLLLPAAGILIWK